MDIAAPHRPLLIAIDPGSSGGIALETENGETETTKMPDTEAGILHFFARLKPEAYTVVVEKVGGYVGKPQPGAAMFTFGRHNGFLLGVLMALKFRVEMVTPQAWQKSLGAGTVASSGGKPQWKRKLRDLAQRKYPNLVVTLYSADALLILDWAKKSL